MISYLQDIRHSGTMLWQEKKKYISFDYKKVTATVRSKLIYLGHGTIILFFTVKRTNILSY